LNHSNEEKAHLQKEKNKIEDTWMLTQEKLSSAEEEITQCRAHIDLYKMRVQEEQDLKTDLQNQIKELVAKKATQEEDFRHRLSEASNNYELQLRNMRTGHEQVKEISSDLFS
jgi:DNA-binding helix-hairpin-helix protein with protein kinase domain